jgi:hypothetical protein
LTDTEQTITVSRGVFARAGQGLATLGLNRPRNLVIWTIVVGTAIRLITAALYGFGNGESYYLATARHFALSYFDQPPLSLWIAWATMNITGSETELVMRLPFILMFAGATWLMYRFGAVLFGEAAGAFAAFLLNLSPVFAGMAGVWMQPDGPLMLFLVATMLLVAKLALAPEKGRQLGLWIGAGICLGLAMLAKYHAALIVAGIVIFAATSRAHRRWFAEPGPYVAVAIALVIFSPVIIWNAQNDWVSFGFQGGRITDNVGIHLDWFARMIAGQIAYIGPWVWLPMIWVFWRALRRGPGEANGWLLCCTAILPVIVFTAASLWAPLGWHFHWQAPGYLMLFPLLGAATVRWVESHRHGIGAWLLGSALVTAAVMLVLATQSSTGWLRIFVPDSLWPSLEGISDPTLEGLDWNALRDRVSEEGWLDADRLFVVAPQWHVAGKVDVQLGRDLPVVCLCEDPRNIAFGWDHKDFAGWDALIVIPPGYVPDPEGTYGPYFASLQPLEPVTVLRGGQPAIELRLYYATGYDGDYPLPLPP